MERRLLQIRDEPMIEEYPGLNRLDGAGFKKPSEAQRFHFINFSPAIWISSSPALTVNPSNPEGCPLRYRPYRMGEGRGCHGTPR
jgi:hypothetical protein